MLDPEVPDDRRDAITGEARQRIEAGSTLKQERSWGTRVMAYEIERRTEADYRFFRFENGAGVLDDLNHSLRITDGVLRFRIFKVDASAPVIEPPPPINLAATAAPRSGGRGGRQDDRPPRGPEPEAQAAPAAETEPTPAPETPLESPQPPEPEPAPETPLESPQPPEPEPAPETPLESPQPPEPEPAPETPLESPQPPEPTPAPETPLESPEPEAPSEPAPAEEAEVATDGDPA